MKKIIPASASAAIAVTIPRPAHVPAGVLLTVLIVVTVTVGADDEVIELENPEDVGETLKDVYVCGAAVAGVLIAAKRVLSRTEAIGAKIPGIASLMAEVPLACVVQSRVPLVPQLQQLHAPAV